MRVEYPGAIYHLMDRGDRQEDIFVDDVDRQDFLKTLAEACRKTDWQVHAYCLMRNSGAYLAAPEHRPGWVRVDRLLGEHGIQEDSAAGRQEFERHMEARRLEEADEEALKPLRRGWCLGSEEFRQKMLGLMDGKLGDHHSGELRRETAEQKANRIICEELLSRGWKESDLTARSRSDRGKLAIAARLRGETTLPIKWIAARVHIGTAKGAKTVLHQLAHGHHQRKPASATERCAQLEFQSTV